MQTRARHVLNASLFAVAFFSFSTHHANGQISPKVSLVDDGKKVVVNVGSKHFTSYDYSTYKKPILYPLLGPSQISMTRNFPMKKVAGESDDHPHHKSLWVGHEISGVDFWSEKGGSVRLQNIRLENDRLIAEHNWVRDHDNKVITSDQVEIRFYADKRNRLILYKITFVANKQPVVFEDTKEGTFAIRIHPNLRSSPDSSRGVKKVFGNMENSNRETGKSIWGKKAKWVNYFGKIDNRECGLAIFDHPENLRHPTTWHARDYGLLAANPFGLQYFQNGRIGQGKYQLNPGESLKFEYCVCVYEGKKTHKDLGRVFNRFAKKD